MNQDAMNIIIRELSPIFTAQNMVKQDGSEEIYANDKFAVKVWYDERKKLFCLDMAQLEEGNGVEFSTISSWLFDEGHTQRDAMGVAGDFCDTLNSKLGIKRSYSAGKEISLPGKSKPGSTPGIEAFTNRFLTLFPQYKDLYKQDLALYGDYMYENFMSKTAAVKFREIALSDDKRQIVKMLTMLDEYYVDADNVVQGIITYTIIGGAFYDQPELFEKIISYYEGNSHIHIPGRMMLEYIIKKEKRGNNQ